MSTRILLADDDVELCDLLSEYLRGEGFDVECVHDGAAAVAAVARGQHEIAVLDVMMPALNGFDALREIRSQSTIPVLMLTARDEDVDRIVGLEMGADDYLAKPFNPRELLARIKAVLRRAEHAPSTKPAPMISTVSPPSMLPKLGSTRRIVGRTASGSTIVVNDDEKGAISGMPARSRTPSLTARR